MNRAFVKELDGDEVVDDQPERIHSDLPNYITREGLAKLKKVIKDLQQQRVELAKHEAIDAKAELQRCDRDLRYLRERLNRAIPVDVPDAPPNHVQFGVTVKLVDENDEPHVFSLVGEDETDIEAGRISWASPIARLLMDREVGDTIIWRRGETSVEAEVVEISV
ncbi:MAG: GreA/GreB family elongation factor [Gammaproteobacteria bacterium]|nr:GreA/GreB family elongation factor [Gammaproteobacteria bacterium]